MLISLIVPCYNEEEAMPLFYQEAARVAAQMEKSHGAEFEIIFVDDGSKDGTCAWRGSCTMPTACALRFLQPQFWQGSGYLCGSESGQG